MNNHFITGLIVVLFLAPVVLSVLLGRRVKLDTESVKASESRWKTICSNAPYSYLGHYKYRWSGERRTQADAELADMSHELGISASGLGTRMAIIDIISMILFVIGLSFKFNIAVYLIAFLCSWYLFSLLFIGLS